MGSALLLCAIQSAVFGLITLAVIPVVLSRQPDDVVISALIYTAYVPLYMVSIMLNAVLNGLHRYSWFNGVFVTVAVMMVAAQTVLLLLGVLSVGTIVIAYLVVSLLITVLCAYLVRRAGVGKLPREPQDRPAAVLLRDPQPREHGPHDAQLQP